MLKASLAERLGRLSAVEADALEHAEFWGIERPLLQAHSPARETEIERAFRRSSVPSSCAQLRRFMPYGGEWECQHFLLTRNCRALVAPYQHTLVTAPQRRAFGGGTEVCGVL